MSGSNEIKPPTDPIVESWISGGLPVQRQPVKPMVRVGKMIKGGKRVDPSKLRERKARTL